MGLQGPSQSSQEIFFGRRARAAMVLRDFFIYFTREYTMACTSYLTS
jgi:hypothetical protein